MKNVKYLFIATNIFLCSFFTSQCYGQKTQKSSTLITVAELIELARETIYFDDMDQPYDRVVEAKGFDFKKLEIESDGEQTNGTFKVFFKKSQISKVIVPPKEERGTLHVYFYHNGPFTFFIIQQIDEFGKNLINGIFVNHHNLQTYFLGMSKLEFSLYFKGINTIGVDLEANNLLYIPDTTLTKSIYKVLFLSSGLEPQRRINYQYNKLISYSEIQRTDTTVIEIIKIVTNEDCQEVTHYIDLEEGFTPMIRLNLTPVDYLVSMLREDQCPGPGYRLVVQPVNHKEPTRYNWLYDDRNYSYYYR